VSSLDGKIVLGLQQRDDYVHINPASADTRSSGRWIITAVSSSQVQFHPRYRLRNGIRIVALFGL
jgi:hypothetical protein